MRFEEEVRAKMNELIERRALCPDKYCASYRMLNERATALAWVLKHPKVTDIVPSADIQGLFDCLY